MKKYPLLEINLSKISNNIKEIKKLAETYNIKVTGVIKGINALEPVINQFIKNDCFSLASSRLEHLITIKKINKNIETMLIRSPMLSEVSEMIKWVSVSLNSEKIVLKKIEEECIKKNIFHEVILMVDLGDLREGFYNKDDLIKTALYIEKKLKHVKLKGIGVNLGCYGSIKPNELKMEELSKLATKIETKINRELELISGGSTSSLTLVLDNKKLFKINHLRVGRGILLNYDLPKIWGYETDFLYDDTLILKAEVIELKNKPSYPVGEIFVDAFGNPAKYKDIGNHKRAIVAVGRLDFGDCSNLIPINEKIKIIGASSDHLILDVSKTKIKIGDIISFKLNYPGMLYLSSSKTVFKFYKTM